jgi:CPA2 family monovalent cation:H+ antiporter-2
MFLVGLAAAARYGARLVSRLVGTKDEEIVVVLAIGLAVVTAGLAERLGVSDAIGAFMIGLILGATTTAGRLRTLTHPLRDGFGALFFFHFGLTIDPSGVLKVAAPITVAVLTTIVLCVAAGVLAARIHGLRRMAAANIGLTVLARGEFSLVLAALALSSGLDPRLGAFTAGYVFALAVIGPVAVTASAGIARLLPAWRRPDNLAHGSTAPLDMDVGTSQLYRLGAELLQVQVKPGSRLHGVAVRELRLPPATTLGLLVRDGQTSAPLKETQLQADDVLLLFTRPGERIAVEQRIRALHRSGRLARWHGDTGG